jgi:hypothetical protein
MDWIKYVVRSPKGKPTMKHNLSTAVLIACVSTLALLAPAQGQTLNPMVGFWKLNVEKSQWTGPAATSDETKIEALENGIRLTSEGVDGQGHAFEMSYTVKFDGTDYPFHSKNEGKAAAAGMTVAIRKIDNYNYDVTDKTNGKITYTQKVIFSKDGKTRTLVMTARDAEGKPAKVQTLIYERQ